VNALLEWKRVGEAGGFTTVDIARLLGRSPSQIAAWLRGSPPLIEADYQPLHGRPVLSFDALVEARAISHFLGEGVKPARLRRIVAGLRRSTGAKHPLALDRQLVTDGFRLLELTDGGHLVNLANEVYAHQGLMRQALVGRVIYRGGQARFFEPDPVGAPLIRVDPRLAFGRPVIVERRRVVPTAAIADTAEDEGILEAASWFGVSENAVTQARDFERRLAA
jgi:uncharacterized protein (DUF433 family)